MGKLMKLERPTMRRASKLKRPLVLFVRAGFVLALSIHLGACSNDATAPARSVGQGPSALWADGEIPPTSPPAGSPASTMTIISQATMALPPGPERLVDSVNAYVARHSQIGEAAFPSMHISDCPIEMSSSLCFALVQGYGNRMVEESMGFFGGLGGVSAACPFVKMDTARWCVHLFLLMDTQAIGCPNSFTVSYPQGEHGNETWTFERTSPYAKPPGSTNENYRARVTFAGGSFETQGRIHCASGGGGFVGRHRMP